MTRSSTLFFVGLVVAFTVGCQRTEAPADDRAAAPSIVKVSALASGEILVDGKPCSLDELAARLSEAGKNSAQIYYYREAADQEPHPNAMAAVQLIADTGLPVSLSAQPDFSDYVDEQGNSHPRP